MSRLLTSTLAATIAVGAMVGMTGFTAGCACPKSACSARKGCIRMESKEFYTDGKFDTAKANQAYFDMMDRFNVPAFESFKKDPGYFWSLDFHQNDFASIGMGGVIYVNEKAEGYFNHDIFLLPFQSICEHRHLPTVDKETGKPIRCKMESWLVRKGWVYSFGEVGEPNLDKFPEAKARLAKAQIPHMKCRHVEKWTADGRAHKLAAPESWHFLMGGSEGAIVNECATYHDGNGLRFSIPSAAF